MELSVLHVVVIFFEITIVAVSGWLLFPQNTVLQITASVSAPVQLPDLYRLYFDWGFQVNYILPWALSNFYDIPKWPGLSKMLNKRAISYEKYGVENGTHPSDATAGQIYMTIEDIMISYGFHETCLLKSVCEVAKHPFDLGDENLLAEIVNFVLSPSLHKSFGRSEKVYKQVYEAAERYGANGVDCDFIYPYCSEAFINIFTKILHE